MSQSLSEACLTSWKLCNCGCTQGMNLDPNLMSMMKGMDSVDVNSQLESLGLSPSEVINKIMAEPDLAAAFQKPKVMQVSLEALQPPHLTSCLSGTRLCVARQKGVAAACKALQVCWILRVAICKSAQRQAGN